MGFNSGFKGLSTKIDRKIRGGGENKKKEKGTQFKSVKITFSNLIIK